MHVDMLTVLISLSIVPLSMRLSVDSSHCQPTASPTCDQLPKVEIPSIEVLSANSPFEVDFSLTSLFNCTTIVFTNPARGATDYDGTGLFVQGSSVKTIDYTVLSDNKSALFTDCSTGDMSIWHPSAIEVDVHGSFFCMYTCNGTALADFACASNNNGSSPNEQKAVDSARKVPNGHLIHNGKRNCPGRHGCQAF